MRVYGQWFGGSSYSVPQVDEEVEVFASMSEAYTRFSDRYWFGYSFDQPFTFADGQTVSTRTPCVDLSAEMRLYFTDPREMRDPYPDRVVSFGPHGGVRVERV